MPFNFTKLDIKDVVLVEPKVFSDGRGYFLETFKKSDFTKEGLEADFVQDNYSYSEKGVLRGLHWQNHPQAQAKLVQCVQGEIFDVAVDVRQGSPTYGQWVSETLSEENKKMLYIPIGFAHGFCVISDTAKIIYKCTDEYAPDLERGVIWNDPDIGVEWPTKDPSLSERDQQNVRLKDIDNNMKYESAG